MSKYTIKFEEDEEGYDWGCYEDGELMQRDHIYVARFKTQRGAENFMRRGSAYHLPVSDWTLDEQQVSEETPIRYVKIDSGDSVHRKNPATGKTVCGLKYRHLDYMTILPEELEENYQHLCHRCEGTKRPGPRTIREAFTPANAYEVRHVK